MPDHLLTFFAQCLTTATWSLPTEPKARSLIDAKAQISTDSIIGKSLIFDPSYRPKTDPHIYPVGTSTQVGERASTKRSTIGKHCKIGKMAKITGCVLLDHCSVEDGYECSSYTRTRFAHDRLPSQG